jgi:hypothetical protein
MCDESRLGSLHAQHQEEAGALGSGLVAAALFQGCAGGQNHRFGDLDFAALVINHVANAICSTHLSHASWYGTACICLNRLLHDVILYI